MTRKHYRPSENQAGVLPLPSRDLSRRGEKVGFAVIGKSSKKSVIVIPRQTKRRVKRMPINSYLYSTMKMRKKLPHLIMQPNSLSHVAVLCTKSS